MENQPTHSLVKALRSVPSLASLDDDTLLEIVGDSANLFWRTDSAVFTKGSPADGLYLVVSGSVRVLADGDREVAVLGPGDFFGEFSLLLGTAHQREVRAAEDTELMLVPKERFDALMAEHAELARSIRQKAEERMAANVAPAAETRS